MFLTNYFSILIFFVVSVILASIIFFLSFFLSSKLDDAEKLSAYECGFNPFSDSRSEFDIKFYIDDSLCLRVDLEISFLFQFSVCLDLIQLTGLYVMLLFLFILTIGFYYE
jgi:NADH-quinone oxidoreductase subunit A